MLSRSYHTHYEDTMQYARCGLSSWEYVTEGKYVYRDDFSCGENASSEFRVMPFAEAINCLYQVWNPAPCVATVIDISSSMTLDRIENAKKAAKELVDVLPNYTLLAVYTFNKKAEKIVDYT